MYVFTENYGDVVRWKYYPENDIEELEDEYETYTFLDELLQDVKHNIKNIYDGGFYQNFYAVLVDDNNGKVLKVYEFAIETKITREKTECISKDVIGDIFEDDNSEGWSREYE